MVRPGAYSGAFQIDAGCREGTAEAPIQVFFERRATLRASGPEPPLTARKAFWHFDGLSILSGEFRGAALATSGSGAHHLTFDHARVDQGSGSGVTIGSGSSHITIANSHIHRRGVGTDPDSSGIKVAPGAHDILIIGNSLHDNSGGSVKVGGLENPSDSPRAVETLSILANTIHDDRAAAVCISALSNLRIAQNTIYRSRPVGPADVQAILIENVQRAVIEENHISGSPIGIQVGLSSASGESLAAPPEDVWILRNYLEDPFLREGSAINVEAGRSVRVCNNVIDQYADAIMLLGGTPQTEGVSIANNLVLRVSDIAFLLADPKSAIYFDHNVFSPRGRKVDVQIGKETLDLARFLEKRKMPHTRLVPGVSLMHRDLARINGFPAVDAGKALEGIVFIGAAPDIGVAER